MIALGTKLKLLMVCLFIVGIVKTPKKIRTKVVAHFVGNVSGIISERELITVNGRIMYYDHSERTWKPLGGLLKIVLDGRDMGKFLVDREGFSFSFIAPSKGKHRLEIRYIGDDEFESNYKTLKFQVLSKDEKMLLLRFVSIAYFFTSIVYVVLFVMMVLLLTIAASSI